MRTFPLDQIPEIGVSFPELQGRVALVTGGERGIGQGIAAFLGRQGMRLAIAGRSVEEGECAVAQFQDAGMEAVWLAADLGERRDVDRVVDGVLERFGEVDLLVNNAAAQRMTEFLAYDDEIFELSFEKNVRMVYYLTHSVGRWMVEHEKAGSIVNISSVGGVRAHRGSAGYDAAKGAIDSLTRAVALELAPHGIRVNAIAPGAIANRAVTEKDRPFRERQAGGIPLGRVGNVSDIGAVTGFLASGAAAYITGQVLYVDGGLTAQLTPPGTYI
ncbi:MAG: SDR family oxidoreductase [Pseudomonadales bacterium]|nr:SDR family oxidoreductase [Pseudomonadales bacterium]